MTLTQKEIEAAAAELFEAEKTGKQIGLLSVRHPEMTMDDAYAVQTALVTMKRESGNAITGWKIGLTSKAMQLALGIDIPDSGVLFEDMHFKSGETVPKNRFIQPRIEAEIAFFMKSDLGGEHVTRDDVINATEAVAPSIEILDTRILRADPSSGAPRKIVDTISDNAANAGIVLGEARHPIDAHDLRWIGAIVKSNGEVEETGLGAGVLDDPIKSVQWLAHRMALYGQTIKAGQVVLSGSFIRPLECPSGTQISADFGSFGTIDIAFD